MAQVKVWNDNVHPFTQEFKDQKITIPAGKYIMMDEYEATEFLGKYYPMVLGSDNLQDPRSYKKLRKEYPQTMVLSDEPHTFNCNGCGKSFQTESILEAHINEYHLAEMADQELAKKRGPGRPPKAATA